MRRLLLYITALFVVLGTVYAAFPNSATWLPYADLRLIYQIDTSSITENTANIYATISVDLTTLQNYINKWSSYCDPSGVYPWFYPTILYASTNNKNLRMVKIVEMSNTQTFNVGSCGSVELPTTFKVLLPNGVLDGGSNFGNYQHYLFVNYKYPYFYDFEDAFPPTIPPYIFDSDSGTINYSNSFEWGYYINPSPPRLHVLINKTINTSDEGKYVLCAYAVDDGEYHKDVWLSVELQDGNRYSLSPAFNGKMCIDIARALKQKVGDGTYDVKGVGVYDDAGGVNILWIWYLPKSIYEVLRSGG